MRADEYFISSECWWMCCLFEFCHCYDILLEILQSDRVWTRRDIKMYEGGVIKMNFSGMGTEILFIVRSGGYAG